MSPARIGVLVGLELRQRARRAGFYVLLGIFFVVVSAITLLGLLVFSGSGSVGSGMYSIAVYGVLLMTVLVTPTFTGNAVNGDRADATLAPVQVTLATTTEILLAKLFAGWATGLVYLLAALPVLLFALVWGYAQPGEAAVQPHPMTLLVSVVVLIVEIGVVSAIGVGLSAVIARPLFSVAATYLIVMLLVVGTLIAFGLGGFAVRSDRSTLTESPTEVYSTDPSCDPAVGEACTIPRPDVSPDCVEVLRTSEAYRFDRFWWLLAANPFVVLADATPTTYDADGYPVDLFGQLKYGIRTAQHAPQLVDDDWSDPCDGEPPHGDEWYGGDDEQYPSARDEIEGSVPSWFVGLGVQILLAGGLMVWGAVRTRTPARRTPPGSRIA